MIITSNTLTDRGTATHPHVATIVIDPAVWASFQRTFEDRPEVILLGVDREQPDVWTVRAACASLCVRDLLEGNW
jgi:hypothetical protein